jgi:hypothetical protein
MPMQPVDYFLAAWFAAVMASTFYVGWDQFRNNPEPVVMKWGFILVTLYMGPLGLLLYVLADKEPRPGEHEHGGPFQVVAIDGQTLRWRRADDAERRLVSALLARGSQILQH